jgi:hypothetical protein
MHFQKGEWREAREYLEKAIEAGPEEPEFHILLGRILFREGDLPAARWESEAALGLDPDHPRALELSGDILYQEGYLTRAIPLWERALKKAGNQAALLRRKTEKAQKELEAETGFGREVSVHFTLQFDGPVPGKVRHTVLRFLEDAYDRIGEELGHYPQNDIPVILYSRIQFKEITSSPSWAAGTFDGKIRVPTAGLTHHQDFEQLRSVLAHELAHAFLRSIAPQGLPLWFEEGLAKHFEGIPTEAAQAWLGRHAGRRFSTLEELNRALQGRGGSVRAAYLASLLAVRLLIEREGLWTARRVVEEVGSGRPFPQAFQGEVRLEPEEFQEMWRGALP